MTCIQAWRCRSLLFLLVLNQNRPWITDSLLVESKSTERSCTLRGTSCASSWGFLQANFCGIAYTCLGNGWFSDGVPFSWELKARLPNQSTKGPTPGCSGRFWLSIWVPLRLWGQLSTHNLSVVVCTWDVDNDPIEANVLGPVGYELGDDCLWNILIFLLFLLLFFLVFSIHRLSSRYNLLSNYRLINLTSSMNNQKCNNATQFFFLPNSYKFRRLR